MAKRCPICIFKLWTWCQKVMPSFVQIFIEKPVDTKAGRAFEDQLFLLRRN